MKLRCFFAILAGLFLTTSVAYGQPGDKADPVPTQLGDKDDTTLQNKRILKVRNETTETLTVYLQFRTLVDEAWTWIPTDPAKALDAISFQLEPGIELGVQHADQPLSASRMRIWAISPTQKWLKNKTLDVWLVPERNENGEHVYLAPAVEPFVFVFSSDKDKGVIPGDAEIPGEQSLPTEGGVIVPPPPDIPWDVVPDPLPPDFPIVRDLSVLPVSTTGPNATIRVKNLGHFSPFVGRRLYVQRVAPGAIAEDKGAIGPLFHYSVKTFYLVGMPPGNYVAYVSPGDIPPFDLNDKRSFSITGMVFSDAAMLPVSVSGGKAYLKVKNVGTTPLPPGKTVKIRKLPMGPILDVGGVAMLPVNGIQNFGGVTVAPGTYEAYVWPGDNAPHQWNDKKTFIVSGSTHFDHDIQPVMFFAGKATIKVKNIGSAPTPVGAHLKIQKLPMGPIIDLGQIGVLGPFAMKTYSGITLAPAMYKAYVFPGDPAPYHGNDSETFTVAGASPDLEANAPFKVGKKGLSANIHCHGAGAYSGGTRTWHLEKFVSGSWKAVPFTGSHIIGAIPHNGSITVHGMFTGPGSYRLRLTPGDANLGNDSKTIVLP